MTHIAEMLGIHYRTIQKWAAWYRADRRAEVLRRITGHKGKGVNLK